MTTRSLSDLAMRFKSFSPHTLTRLLWTALALFCLALFVKLCFSIHGGSTIQAIDDTLLRAIGSDLRSPEWDYLWLDLTGLGSRGMMYALCAVSVVLFVLARDPAAAIHLFITVFGSIQLVGWSKSWVERSRPSIIPKLIQAGGQSFPSGHAVTSAAVYLTLAILACRHFKGYRAHATLFALAFGMIATVSFSRLYLGVHYPSDVISGALLGSAWALFLGALFSKRHSVRSARR